MLVRSSLKKLAKTLYYPMSKKKIT